MSLTFSKLASSITDSSIWSQDDHTRLIWITMLAISDQFGRVFAAIPGLANRARVPIESVERAIQTFLSPDPYSRTKAYEGKRIEIIEGGWRLLNYEFYRDLKYREDRKEQNRLAQARKRERKRQQTSALSANVINNHQKYAESAHADADADADADKDISKDISPIANAPVECEKKDDKKQSKPRISLEMVKYREEFINEWKVAFKEFFGSDYMFTPGKDKNASYRILVQMAGGFEEIIETAKSAWQHMDGFWCKHSVTINGFVYAYNNIKQELGILTPQQPVKPKCDWI